jgi:hypothetical protein
MNVSSSVVADRPVADDSVVDEFSSFLAATATVLRETVTRFERTTARITERVRVQPGQMDRDLIVTLQDFDRLQQEFAMFVQVLMHAAGKTGESWLRQDGGSHPAEDTIAAVSVADLKDRLKRHLDDTLRDIVPETEEVEF